MGFIGDLFFYALLIIFLLFVASSMGCLDPWIESYDQDCIKYSQELNLTYIPAVGGEILGFVVFKNETLNCIPFVKYVKKIKEEGIKQDLQGLVGISK